MNIDDSSAVLQQALRELGEALGKALADGITRGVQEGLSRSLDLDGLSSRAPARAAEGFATGITAPRRRGGRPRSEARACRVEGCDDPARSRGLCSRHYQQELRRERTGEPEVDAPATPPAPVEARPPLIRRKAELPPPPAPAPAEPQEPSPVAAPVAAEPATEASTAAAPAEVAAPIVPGPGFTELPRSTSTATSAADAARRVFGGPFSIKG